ncbi:hypothetical protein HPB51_009283 [Rhipicephalus microplus]|uniref:Sugar transporter n=1 Tax=Rhipicephalus microplus TaxID=6941 RepID=A0A9J6F039_RHIMP|nr:hypothetical protein HPB51_009283 [Rhipicephalus microplus]
MPTTLTTLRPVSCYNKLTHISHAEEVVVACDAKVSSLMSVISRQQTCVSTLPLTVVPSVLMVVSLPFCPESPKYLLLVRGRPKQAEEALVRLRGTRDVDKEMAVMKNEAEAAEFVPKVTLPEMIRNASLRAPLIVSLMVMLAQQLSGINAVSLATLIVCLYKPLRTRDSEINIPLPKKPRNARYSPGSDYLTFV